jgi:spoIIIJ-associated protein
VIVTPRPGVMVTGARPAVAAEDDDLDDEYEDDEYEDDEEYEEGDEEADEDDEEYEDERSGVAATPAGTRALTAAGGDGDAVAVAVEILEQMLSLLDIDANVTARPPETPGDGTVAAVLDISGDELGMLIGRRGETLASMQYLVNLMLNRRVKTRTTVGIDVEGYRRRREETLRSLARRMADRVISSGQSITLEPMPPNERRIVHLTLADHPDVLTVSIGEGDARKVAITPKR